MMLDAMKRFFREEDGLEMLEWAIVALLFAVAGAATWLALGTAISTELTDVQTSLENQNGTF